MPDFLDWPQRWRVTQGGRYETTDQDGNSMGFQYRCVLACEETPYQEIRILDSEQWGKVLLLDGEVQSSSVDESLMNEIRAHVPFYSLRKEQINKGLCVLILGGGNGSTLKELLKHPQVTSVDLVEIDRRVIELCVLHMPDSNLGGEIFKDPRVRVIVGDGYQFLQEQESKKYDLIVVDCTSPHSGKSLAAVFYQENFFRLAQSRMAPEGILTIPSGVPTFQDPLVKKVLAVARRFFAKAGFMKSHVPTFGLGQWTVVWATDGMGLNESSAFKENLQHFPVTTNIYNSNVHFSSLHHDKWLQSLEHKRTHE